jgi:hypothetical protein
MQFSHLVQISHVVCRSWKPLWNHKHNHPTSDKKETHLAIGVFLLAALVNVSVSSRRSATPAIWLPRWVFAIALAGMVLVLKNRYHILSTAQNSADVR